MAEIHIAKGPADWVNLAANFIASAAQKALSENDRFVLALSGGGTPRPIYQALPEFWHAKGLNWERTHIIWSDERCVPLNDPQSNYRMARESIIEKIDIPERNVHPMGCDDDPLTSAAAYESTLRELYPHQAWPTIDLCLLGMGADGHTASLFPDSPALNEEERWVVANQAPGVENWRLTLTLPVINRAASIAFLVTGSNKAETLHQVLQGSERGVAFPAGRVQPQNGQLHWFLDAEAARRLARS